MRKLLSLFTALLFVGSMWADPTVLFHETFGDNSGSARNWSDSYSEKSGVAAVYSGITSYTVTNAKQGKNTTGSTKSGLNQSSQGTDAVIIIGPLNVENYNTLALTYQWKAASIKGTYSTSLYYATSSNGSYTEVTGTGAGATSFVEREYNLPTAAQVSTLYLKIIWNTSNTQAIIDEVELTGEAAPVDPSVVATPAFSLAGGTYLGTQSVEITCETDGASIYYTTDGTDPTSSSAAYTSAISVSSTETIKAIATKADMTNSNIASATYTIVHVDHAGTAEDPYSVADARTAIDAEVGLTDVYAKGIVTVNTISDINYGKLTYDLSEDGKTASDQLRAYNGKYTNGDDFTDNNKVREGDEVIVYGTLTKYGDIYEFAQYNQLYSLVARTPNFSIADVEFLAVGADDIAVSGLEVSKEGEGAITLSSGNNEIATIVDNKIHPVAAGDVTITANLAANGIYRATSTTFNVHVIIPCHNNITLTKGTPEHGSFTMDKENGEYPTCEDAFSVVVTPGEAAEHYHFSAVVAPNSTSITGPVDGKYTVTYAQNTNAASEINVIFEEDAKSVVTWNVNGDESVKTNVYNGEKPAFPATPSAIDATSTTFYGWATAAWDGKLANLNEKTVYTTADAMPVVSGTITYYAVFAKATAGEDVKYDGPSFSRSETTDTYTEGYTFDKQAEAKSGYYQDGSGTLRYLQVYHESTAMFTTTPKSITVTAKIGGGTGNKDLSNSVYAQLVDKTGTPIGTAAVITEHITTNTGDNYTNISIPTAGITSAYGLRIYHTKESGYNVRYYSFSMTYTLTNVSYSGFVTTTHAVTFNASPEHGTLDITDDEVNSYTSGDKFAEGALLYVWADPADGYKLKAIKVVKTAEPEVDVTTTVYNDEDAYITMPAYAITVSAEFEEDKGTALNNTEVEGKAVKVLRNGILYIEKGGKQYNVMGQLIK